MLQASITHTKHSAVKVNRTPSSTKVNFKKAIVSRLGMCPFLTASWLCELFTRINIYSKHPPVM